MIMLQEHRLSSMALVQFFLGKGGAMGTWGWGGGWGWARVGLERAGDIGAGVGKGKFKMGENYEFSFLGGNHT